MRSSELRIFAWSVVASGAASAVTWLSAAAPSARVLWPTNSRRLNIRSDMVSPPASPDLRDRSRVENCPGYSGISFTTRSPPK